MVIVGVVGYIKTPRGLRSLNTVWAQHLSEEVKRRFYKNWYRPKKKVFVSYSKKYESAVGKQELEAQLDKMKKYASVVRVLAHTQLSSSLVMSSHAEGSVQRISARIAGATVNALWMGLLYLVMLAVMSFNVGVLIPAIVGHALGFLVLKVEISTVNSLEFDLKHSHHVNRSLAATPQGAPNSLKPKKKKDAHAIFFWIFLIFSPELQQEEYTIATGAVGRDYDDDYNSNRHLGRRRQLQFKKLINYNGRGKLMSKCSFRERWKTSIAKSHGVMQPS